MKRFKFSLDQIFSLRQSKRDEVKKKLGLILGRITKKKSEISKINSYIQTYYEPQDLSNLSGHGELISNIRKGLKKRLSNHNNELDHLVVEEKEIRKALIKADIEVKKIEKMREKEEKKYLKEQKKKRQNMTDELIAVHSKGV